jgi:hypothetical protein
MDVGTVRHATLHLCRRHRLWARTILLHVMTLQQEVRDQLEEGTRPQKLHTPSVSFVHFTQCCSKAFLRVPRLNRTRRLACARRANDMRGSSSSPEPRAPRRDRLLLGVPSHGETAAAAAGSDDSGCNFPLGSVVAVRGASTNP